MKSAGILLYAVLAAMAAHHAALAQNYPVKPVRMIVPFPPGGGVDVTARVLSQALGEGWGQQLIVENRAGAGAIIGSDVVAKSAPDGYTLLITTSGHALLPVLYRKLPFDAVNDFAPVTDVHNTYLVLAVNSRLPATSVKELIALAKANPGKLNYGHTGIGVSPHLTAEMFRIATGIDVVAVPYKGDSLVIPALVADEVQFTLLPPTNVLEPARAGRLRLLAMTGQARASGLPNVPTTAEAGLPEVEQAGWVGLFAAAGTPRDILGRISGEVARAVRAPIVAARIRASSYDAGGATPEQFAAKFRADVARFTKIVRDIGVPPAD
ncbi:MAG: hypothetical protein A3H91_13915 [Gammaproteobacteria bacterium RIFCSPLOWO2_02_FULL_61_13]|nr:MAG: hypothetical protein A3H91_13915 [Gammaproteobacteria bacterium RIFCSPLOWO2_02_FULL_61_13]